MEKVCTYIIYTKSVTNIYSPCITVPRTEPTTDLNPRPAITHAQLLYQIRSNDVNAARQSILDAKSEHDHIIHISVVM